MIEDWRAIAVLLGICLVVLVVISVPAVLFARYRKTRRIQSGHRSAQTLREVLGNKQLMRAGARVNIPMPIAVLISSSLIAAGCYVAWLGVEAGFIEQQIRVGHSGHFVPKRGPSEHEGGEAMLAGVFFIFMGGMAALMGVLLMKRAINKPGYDD